uniref:Uncharacterized protein n=1 Tax=Arundo donax TaxID=35708 RepID=A0A0A9D0S9_ARUDO
MFHLPRDQAEPCNLNFEVQMHQLLSNKQPELEEAFPESQELLYQCEWAGSLPQESDFWPCGTHQTLEDHRTQIHTTEPIAANVNSLSQRMLSSCYKLRKLLHL